MRRFFLLSSAALSMLAVGCATPQSVCESGVQTSCARLFECSAESVKSSDSFKSLYGTNTAECETRLTVLSKCNELESFDDLCAEGDTYDLGRASECIEGIKAQSCADFNDTAKRPAVCSQVCH